MIDCTNIVPIKPNEPKTTRADHAAWEAVNADLLTQIRNTELEIRLNERIRADMWHEPSIARMKAKLLNPTSPGSC